MYADHSLRLALTEIGRALGRGKMLRKEFDRAVYQYDATSVGKVPAAIVLPDTPDDVAKSLRVFSRYGLPVIPRGAGTNLSGGTTFVHGEAVILEMGRMNRLLNTDAVNERAMVEPGLRNQELQEAVAPLGYFFAPDPASMAVSTLGGNAAENSGGPKCIKYGVTSRHVVGLEVVLTDGSIVHTGGVSDYTPGYDLTGALIGSEGNFGVITKLIVKLTRLPAETRTVLGIFNQLDDAAKTVSAMIAAGVVPMTLELIDDVVLKAVEQNVKVGYPLDAEAVLLIEVDGLPEVLEEDVARIDRICREHGAREVRLAQSVQERELLWRGRREAVASLARLRPSYAEEDVGVPPSLIPRMLREIKSIGERHQLVIGNVFHAGDGNFHPVVLYDERDPDETERMHAANFEIMKVAVKLGGTLTGEHGVGRLKLRGMPLMFGKEEMLFMNELKRAFDPEGVLNPGKVIPPEVLNGRVRGFIDSRVEKAPVEVLEVLSEAGAKGLQVVPTGSGTKLSVGPRQDTPEGSVRLESRGLPKIIDLDRENLTARVSAGVTLKEFQEVLGEDGFFFPADPYWSDSATLGGIVATGDNGSYRYRYGEVRDFVLGVSAVLADGRRLRFGCRTVKNVAGFDVKKLLIGSWGTLGVLIDFTVRVFPKPEPTTVKISFPMIEDLTEFFLEGRQRNHIAPAALEFAGFDPREELGATGDLLTEKEELALVLRFDSSGKATRPQLERLSRMAGEAGAGFETLDSETAQAFWAGRTTVARRLLAGGNTTWLRIGYPLGGFAELYQDLTRMVDEVGAGLALWAHLGNGIADAFIRPRGEIGEITALSKALRQKGGSVYPMFCGPARKALESLYHQRDDGRLASRVKRLFDPANRFGLFRV